MDATNSNEIPQGMFAESPRGNPISHTLYATSLAYGVMAVAGLGGGGVYLVFAFICAYYLVIALMMYRQSRGRERRTLPLGNVREPMHYLFFSLFLIPGVFVGWLFMHEPRYLPAVFGSITAMLFLAGVLASVQRREILRAEKDATKPLIEADGLAGGSATALKG